MSVNKKTHAETVADIIAWLRRPREGENGYLTAWRDEIADRIEAAYKRENAAIEADALAVGGIVEAARKRERGNSAALRNALNLCVDEMCARCRDLAKARGNPAPCLNGCEPVRKAKAALAAPVKNCEVGTAKEQVKRWRRFCNSMTTCGECPCHKSYSEVVTDCFSRWAQMPYEEGGDK